MNKARRKWLEHVITSLEDAKCELESIMDEEQECIDNLPENLQCSSRADEMQEYVDTLDEAISDLDNIIDNLNGI